ncbi:MAG: hypothetical protein O3A84_09350 [Proteobacteria bacterium]|nr:hypothetical protein [Pseudomonadota bacterium]
MTQTDRLAAIFPLAVLMFIVLTATELPKTSFFWIPSTVYLYATIIAILFRRATQDHPRCWIIAGSFVAIFVIGGQVLILEQGIPTRWLDWGRFPTHDAADFLANSHAILTDGSFTSIRGRPMANATLASIWRLSDFDLATLGWIVSALCAVSLTIYGVASLRTFGIPIGVFPIAIAVDFIHEHLGAFSSEPIGFSVGLVSAALLLNTALRPTLPTYTFALFTLGLALFLRAGAMFILPFLLIWPFFLFKTRRTQIQAAALGLCALVFVALLHVSVSRTLTPDSPSFVNAPKSWYAIIVMGDEARGLRPDRPVRTEARWLQIFDDHPGLSDSPISEQGRLFMEILAKNALERPLSVAMGAVIEYGDQIGRAGLFRFIDNKAIRAVTFSFLILGFLVAAWQWRRDPLSSLIFFVGIGVVLSIPFLHGGENRIHAATVGLMAAGAALLIRRFLASQDWRDELATPSKNASIVFPATMAFSILTLSLISAGTFVLPNSFVFDTEKCRTGGSKALWRSGSSVAVLMSPAGRNGLAFRDSTAVETTIREWQSVADRNGWFFYAPIDVDLIRNANIPLSTITEPGALAIVMKLTDGSLARQWISPGNLDRAGIACLPKNS